MASTLNHILTRSRWRVSTSARRTSLLCRWRWSWPAAGRKHMSSCRENSPALCHSSQTSFCYHRNQDLNPGCLLRWCTLMEGERRRENDEEDEKTRGKRGGNIRCEVYLVWQCWRFPEGWMGCGGGKPWLHYPPDLQLEQSKRKEKERKKQRWDGNKMSQPADDVCEHGVLGFTWNDVGRGICFSICTHCAAKREQDFIGS